MKDIYKIYKEMQNSIIAPKDKKTEFGKTSYKYRDIEDILRQIKQFLKDKDYVFYTTELQPIVYGEMPIEYDINRYEDKYGNQKADYLIKTHPLIMKCIRAVLTDGEDKIETDFYYPYEFNTSNMSQGQLGGSNNTYNKKYNLGNALLFDDSKDLDSQEFINLKNGITEQVKEITKPQLNELSSLFDNNGITERADKAKYIKDKFGIQAQDMNKRQFEEVKNELSK